MIYDVNNNIQVTTLQYVRGVSLPRSPSRLSREIVAIFLSILNEEKKVLGKENKCRDH